MSTDARGWRIALVHDALVNPGAGAAQTLPDVMGALGAAGYGVLQLPPDGAHSLLLAVIADQVAEYSHHGYAVVAIGLEAQPGGGLHWRTLSALLRHRGAPLPPRHLVRTADSTAAESARLATFLSGYDVPAEEQRRWRR